jgi:hypothetical protein
MSPVQCGPLFGFISARETPRPEWSCTCADSDTYSTLKKKNERAEMRARQFGFVGLGKTRTVSIPSRKNSAA